MRPRVVLLSVLVTGLVSTAWLGCSSDAGPSARVALFSQVGNGTHTQDECKLGAFQDWVNVGHVGDNKLPGDQTAPVNTGDAWEGHTVTATACNVTGEGDGFQVNVSVTLEGIGSFTANGHFTASQPVTPVQGVFQRQDTGSFSQSDCTATYPRPEMGVAGGRVWAYIDCPNTKLPAQNRTCAAHAEFRFENCTGS
jgi:hypothetical protein